MVQPNRKNSDQKNPAARVNVRSDQSRRASKQAKSPRLERTTFTTSREMDFFSERMLVTQTGHDIGEWPLVFLKETIDNALDACEENDISPAIEVAADATGITVHDNGPGLPESTLQSSLDFKVRASSREAYIAPDRGKQGNALKTLIPMPRVIDPDGGKIVLRAHDKQHIITCGVHPVSQEAVFNDDVTTVPTQGTMIRIEWSEHVDDGNAIWPFDVLFPKNNSAFAQHFRDILEGFALFNPHATFRFAWFGENMEWQATNPEWPKWKPNNPTSVLWYEQQHFQRLIGAYVAKDRNNGTDRFLSTFIAEFEGFAGSRKRAEVLDECDLRRVNLSELVLESEFDSDRIASLLSAMQRRARPVKPPRLGIVGEDHLKTSLVRMGIEPNSFSYCKKTAKVGLPSVMESAFGYLGEDAVDRRRIFTGVNWSAAIKNPFRSFGATGEGLEATLTDLKVGAYEPIVFVLHLAHPRIDYTDHGKSALVVED